jgi:hypothetical protein
LEDVVAVLIFEMSGARLYASTVGTLRTEILARKKE